MVGKLFLNCCQTLPSERMKMSNCDDSIFNKNCDKYLVSMTTKDDEETNFLHLGTYLTRCKSCMTNCCTYDKTYVTSI